MGIFVDYGYFIRCSEEELLARLNRVRRRVEELPVQSISDIYRVDPVYNPVLFHRWERAGNALPPVVAERLAMPHSAEHMELCIFLNPPEFMCLPEERMEEFIAPAVEMAKQNEFWNPDDYPEEFRVGGGLTYTRMGLLLEFATAVLRYGYILVIDPAEGCESVTIGLSTHRVGVVTAWAGGGFTKTQYAVHFQKTHETVCAILDIAREEGLLYAAQDSCGYYETRTWSEEAKESVRTELAFAAAASEAFDTMMEASTKSEERSIEILTPERTYREPFADDIPDQSNEAC